MSATTKHHHHSYLMTNHLRPSSHYITTATRPTTLQTTSNRMMYDSSTEFNLNRAIESITLAQQNYKREFDKKEETIKSLQNKIEVLQFEVRDSTEYKRLVEKEMRELISNNQSLKHDLSMVQRENELLGDDNTRLSQKLSTAEDTVAHLESDIEKANHIIKNLLKKLQNKPQVSAVGLPKTV